MAVKTYMASQSASMILFSPWLSLAGLFVVAAIVDYLAFPLKEVMNIWKLHYKVTILLYYS